MFSLDFDTRDLFAKLDRITDEAREAVRPSAQAGADVIYREVKIRVPISRYVRKLKSGRVILPGALRDSIYQAFSRDRSTDERSTYHISWNYRKAPHGHLVEFGTSRAPAHPFLRPAFDAKRVAALEAARATFVEKMRNVPGVA